MEHLTDEQMTKWIEALRSGFYEQGIGDLKDRSGRYCCLGVLAEINEWRGEFGKLMYPDGPLGGSTEGFEEFYPGLTPEMCWIWNDTRGLSFEEIAGELEGFVNEANR